MKLIIKRDYNEASAWLATHIRDSICIHNDMHTSPFVLGLPTGGSIIRVYEHLIEYYTQEQLSFKKVITFNMDEYIGLSLEHPQSYAWFMHTHLFNHIDINKNNIHLLDGLSKEYDDTATHYEDAIRSYGGIQLFVGGMGSNGHLAFNEPLSSLSSRTRVVQLAQETIEANARYFASKNQVPTHAITVGIQTVMDAKKVALIVTGKNKAHALKHVVEGGVTHMFPASVLQLHAHACIVCDREATSELSPQTLEYVTSAHS